MTCLSGVVLGLGIQASFFLPCCRPFSANPNRRVHQHAVAPPSSASLSSQVLDFIDPTTGVHVKVGAMHYNPASIQLATEVIEGIAAEDKLSSIIIESCDIRWNATLENKVVKDALFSEMKVAHDLGLKYKRPVVLGDQRINITVDQLKFGAKEAAIDLFQPRNGGWGRLAGSIASAREDAAPLGEDYLGLGLFLDPKLLASAPVSSAKYLLSYFVKSPALAAAACVLILLGGCGFLRRICGRHREHNRPP